MPIYKNETAAVIIEKFVNADGIMTYLRFEPGESKTTQYRIPGTSLTLVAAAPYYNPLLVSVETVTSTGVADDKTVPVHIDCRELAIHNGSAVLVTAYVQAEANAPGIPVYPTSERVISLNHNCEQVVLKFAAAATVYVEQRK